MILRQDKRTVELQINGATRADNPDDPYHNKPEGSFMAAVHSTVIPPGAIAPTLRGIDSDDPILREMPRFCVPTIASQHPTVGADGRLKMRVEARNELDQVVWSFDYDQGCNGDPA
jgi:hypothetical protein